jgi:Lon protease-like protein
LAENRAAGPPVDAAVLELALRRMPLFPLPNVVLLPHALLGLHVFEERYGALVRDILTDARLLAVGLFAAGARESDDPPSVRSIVGVGEVVMAHELPDGRFNLVVRGRARVHIDEELASDRPYRLIAATALPDFEIADATEIADADQVLRALIGRLADSIPDGGELLQVVAAQETPAELVDGVAAALIADADLRQRLLETRDLGQRLERVSAEVVAMTARLGTPRTAN